MITNQSLPSPITSFSKCSNKVLPIPKNTFLEVLPVNPNRLYAAFINMSTASVTLILGERSDGSITKGIPLTPGGSFEINLINLYRGKVSITAERDAQISFIECE